MNFMYHGVPDSMVGNQLVPLNKMYGTMSEVREEYLKKYQGREEILQKKVLLLDCLWNDVVQFLPLHPQKVFEIQRKLGFIPEIPPYQFYQIELGSLDSKKTVVYFKNAPGDENVEVKWLSDVDFASLQHIPEATLKYYQSLVGSGELPFNYQFIPHILYKGVVDISGANIIELGHTEH